VRVLNLRRPAGYFAFRSACAHHCVPARQLGGRHNVVHIRVFRGSHIRVRRPAHRLLPLSRQKEILMSRVNVTFTNSTLRPHAVDRLYVVPLLGCSVAFRMRWLRMTAAGRAQAPINNRGACCLSCNPSASASCRCAYMDGRRGACQRTGPSSRVAVSTTGSACPCVSTRTEPHLLVRRGCSAGGGARRSGAAIVRGYAATPSRWL
jgi:hypothetical protein